MANSALIYIPEKPLTKLKQFTTNRCSSRD